MAQLSKNQPQEARAMQQAEPRTSVTPFGFMQRWMEDMDRLFGSPFGREWSGGGTWAPQIEVVEKNGRLEVRADLPGMRPEDVKLTVDKDILTISGERKCEHEEKQQGLYRCERSYGSFERRVALPSGVDPNAVEAHFENGVLAVTMPAPREARGRSIAIKSGPAPQAGGMKS
jgi:HSP20 family protein